MYAGKQIGMWGRYIDLWDTSDAMMEPDKEITYWFFFDSGKDACDGTGKEDTGNSDPDRNVRP